MIFTPQIQAWVLASEGGATNTGITYRTLVTWRTVK